MDRLPLQKFTLKTKDFTSDAEVATLVQAFETATIPASEFAHVAHVAVAVSYVARMPLPEAQARMRKMLLHFTAVNHIDLYHETPTTFWMRLLDHVTRTCDVQLPLWQRINLIVARWGTSAPVKAHYSAELIQSQAAKESWRPPDLLPLSF